MWKVAKVQIEDKNETGKNCTFWNGMKEVKIVQAIKGYRNVNEAKKTC